MRLTFAALGWTFDLSLSPDAPPAPEDDPGSFTSEPIGFTASPGDQRWDNGAQLE